MPPLAAASTVSLRELADLAIGTPEAGAVNFTALHTLIVAMLKNLHLQDTEVDFLSLSPEQSRSFEVPRASLSTPQVAVSKERRRSSVAKVPPKTLESQVKHLGGQVKDLNQRFKTVDSQLQNVLTHVQYFTALVGGLDLGSPQWRLEQETATPMTQEATPMAEEASPETLTTEKAPLMPRMAKLIPGKVKPMPGMAKLIPEMAKLMPEMATSATAVATLMPETAQTELMKILKDSPQAMELLQNVTEDVKMLKEAREKDQDNVKEFPELTPMKLLQRIEEVERLVKDTEDFLEPLSRKLNLTPAGEVNMVTWEELEQAITDGWKASQGGSESTTGPLKHKRQASMASSDKTPSTTSTKPSSMDQALDFAGGFGPDQTSPGTSRLGYPTEGAPSREQGKVSSSAGFPGREQHPRVHDGPGLARPQKPPVSQFRMEPDHHRPREQLGLADLRQGEQDVYPGPVPQDLPSARDRRSPVYPDSYGGVSTRPGPTYAGPPSLDQFELLHPSAYPHGVVPFSTSQLGMMPPGMGEQEFVLPGMGQYDMVPPWVPGRDQQGLEIPSMGQPGVFPFTTYQRDGRFPGPDQRGMEWTGVHGSDVGPPGMDQQGRIPPLTEQQMRGPPGVMQAATDRQGFAQPSLETSDFIPRGTQQQDAIPSGARQPGLVQPGRDQHGLVQPVVDQQGFVQPGVDQRGLVQPGVDQRGLVQPGVDQRGLVHPGVDQRGLVQPGVDQRGLVQPGVDQRGLVHPGVDQRGLVQPGVGQRGFVLPGVDRRGLVQPGVDQRGLVQPGVDQRGLVHPGVDQRGFVLPGVDQRGLVQPGVDQRGLVQPGVGQRGFVLPGVDQRGLVQPGVDQRGLVQPGVDQRGLVQPGVDQRGLVHPGVDQRGLVQPGVDQRGLVQPGVDQRGLVQPGVDQRGLVQPGVDQRGLVHPGVDQQGLVQPGVDQRGLVQPGVDQQGLVQAGVDQRGLVQPGVDQQGLVQPGVDQRGLVQPGVDQQGLGLPGVDQRGLVQPGVDQPGLGLPGVDQPGLGLPGVDQQGLVQPGVDQQGLVQPGVDQWGLGLPGLDQQGLVQPGVDQRGLVQPGVDQPGLGLPGVDQRGLVQPGVDQPGLVQPGVDQPGLVQPGVDQQGLVQPGVDQPGLGLPGVDQRGLVQPGVDQPGLVQPGVDQRGLVQPGVDQRGLVQPGVDQPGLVQPGVGQRGLVQPGAYPHSLVQPGAYPRGLLQPAAYPRGFMQPGTGRYGLVQPGIDQRGLRQLGADHRGWVPLGTEIRGFPFHVDSEGFTSPHPYQHDMVRFGRDRHSLVSPFPTPQGLPLPGIHQEGLVPTEAYAQGLMPPDTDQRRPTPVSPGVGSAHADQQHLESPVPDQWGQIGPSADQHDRERSISDYRGPRGPGHPGVEQYAQGGLDPSQPGTTTSRDAPFPRSADSLDSLHRVASERGSIPRERHDSLEKVAPSFPIAVETFRLMGELTGLYMELKKTMKELDEKKSGQTDLEKIQYLLSLMVQKTVPPDLQEQLKAIKSLTKEVRQEKVQLEKMQKILDGEGYQDTGKEIKPGHLGLQLGVLRVTVADIEKELAELRKSQEQGQVSMEHSVSEASLYLQDQLDKLRTVIESMLSSSSTLLSLSMPPPKAPITLAPGQIDPEATCPACSLNLSHQVCTLVQRYEQLQNMVNNLSASRPSKKAKLQSQDEELLDRVQKAILQVQGDCEKLNATTSSLIEDHRQKQKDIDVLYQGLEKLDKEKANREHLEMGMDVKADKSALAAKVSRVQFDATTEQLNHMMQELVAKMTGQEQDWQKMLDKLLTEMDGKLDRLELDPVKQLLEDRWKALRQQLKERSPFYQADEAAAMRRQLLAHFHCLSCDRPLETPVTGKVIPVTPVGPSLPGHRSMRPYTVFELEQIRQQSRNLKLGRTAFPRAELAPLEQSVGRLRTMHSKMLKDIEKVQTHFGGSVKASSQMIHELLRAQCLGSPCYKRVPDMANYTCPAVPRRCGGSHTLAYPFRRSRLQHLPQCRDPEEVQIAMKHNEVDILGLDGHIYKGRLDTRLPGIPSKGSPVTTKQKNKPSRPYAHRQPFVSDDRQLPSRLQSAQMLAGDTPAPSHQRTDRPVSSEGRLSQQNLAHPPSPRERAAGLEIHVNVPPGEGPEEPTRGPRSFTAH